MSIKVEDMRSDWLNPPDYQEDLRPVCRHCGKLFTPASGEPDEYCNASCWHLAHMGSMKAWFTQIVGQSTCLESAIKKMAIVWFPYMTDSTVKRWKRAAMLIMQQE